MRGSSNLLDTQTHVVVVEEKSLKEIWNSLPRALVDLMKLLEKLN